MTDTYHIPALGHSVKLGKLAPRNDDRNLKLANYATAALPKPPTSLEMGQKVTTYPMFANDTLGDCTCAAVGHQEQVWTSWKTPLYTPTVDEVTNLYWETGTPPSTSGTAGGSTDTGRNENDILNYWRNIGFGNSKRKIAAYAEVNVSNATEVKQALYLFGGVYIGVALPITAQGQNYWKVVNDGENSEPGSWGGHAINITAYTSTYLVAITWGMRMKMSWGFWNKYVDEAYAILSPDWADGTGKLPDSTGFNWNQLQTDLSAI